MHEIGVVTDVTTEPDGDELAVAVSGGATSITVKDAADFFSDELTETETTLTIGTETHVYTDVDEDTDVITLATPLASGYSADEKVTLGGHDVLAKVRVGPSPEDSYTAKVGTGLIDRLGDNVFDLNNKVVSLYEGAEEDLYVGTIIGELPQIDGSYIDPVTLPDPASDGLPPAASPAPVITGVPRFLIVKFEGITNNDPVDYDVHISATSGFTPDSATLFQTTSSVLVAIDALPDGTPLAYDTTYFVVVVARDEDGSAAPSVEVPGALDRNGTADIAVGAVTAAHLEAVVALIGKIVTAESGRRVEISNEGIVVYEQDGSILVNLTTDPDSPMTFNGEGVFQSLIASGLSVRASASIERGATVTLESAIQPSQSQPSAVISWPTETLDQDAFPGQKRGLFWNSTDSKWYFCVAGFGSNPISTVNSVSTTGGGLTSTALPSGFVAEGGLTKLGSSWFVLGWYITGLGGIVWEVREFNSSFVQVARWDVNTVNPIVKRPAVGNDGTNLLIAYTPNSGAWRVEFRTTAGAATGTPVISNISPGQADLVGVHLTATSFPSTSSYVIAATNSAGANTDVRVFDASGGSEGNNQANRYWPIAHGAHLCGLGFNGTDFYHLSDPGGDGTGQIVRYLSSNAWTTESAVWWVSYTWYDGDATGGTHETTRSPRRKLTMKKRARLIVTTPTIPDLNGTDDPDRVRMYLHRGASDDAGVSDTWLNATPAAGVTTANIDSPSWSSVANPPTSNNFPGATPGKIQTTGGGTYLLGDGKFRLGTSSQEFQRGIDFGTQTATVSGGGGMATFNHNLGVTPTCVHVTLRAAGGGARFFVEEGTRTSTTFAVRFRNAANADVANGSDQTISYTVMA